MFLMFVLRVGNGLVDIYVRVVGKDKELQCELEGN